MKRTDLRELASSGAADKDVATYDAATNRWAPKAASAGSSSLTVQDENGNVATGVTQIDFQGAGITAASGTGEVVVTVPGGSGSSSRTVLYDNASPTGVITLAASGDTSEKIVSGMDYSTVPVNTPVEVTVFLWEAMSHPGGAKATTARLRDGGPTGPVVASFGFGDVGSDSTAGHQQAWAFHHPAIRSTTGRLCVTVQVTSSATQLTSDARYFTIAQ